MENLKQAIIQNDQLSFMIIYTKMLREEESEEILQSKILKYLRKEGGSEFEHLHSNH